MVRHLKAAIAGWGAGSIVAVVSMSLATGELLPLRDAGGLASAIGVSLAILAPMLYAPLVEWSKRASEKLRRAVPLLCAATAPLPVYLVTLAFRGSTSTSIASDLASPESPVWILIYATTGVVYALAAAGPRRHGRADE